MIRVSRRPLRSRCVTSVAASTTDAGAAVHTRLENRHDLSRIAFLLSMASDAIVLALSGDRTVSAKERGHYKRHRQGDEHKR